MGVRGLKAHKKSAFGRSRETITAFCFLLPSLSGYLIFYFLPFIRSFFYSLVDRPIQGNFVGLANYISLLGNSSFMRAAQNTLIFTAWGVPILVVSSLMLSMALHKNVIGRSALRTAFLSPLVVPVASVALIFTVFFHQNGALNGLLVTLGQDRIDFLKSDWARATLLLLFVWKNLGYMMVLFLAGLLQIPQEHIEAADIDGGTALDKLLYITLPQLMPTMLFVIVMSIVNSFKVFREAYLLAGDYPHESIYMLQHYMNNVFGSLDYQKLTSAAFMMAVVVSALVILLLWAERRYGDRML